MIPQPSPAGALRASLDRRIDSPARPSLTIGMGLAPADGDSLEAVLKAVDAAMYRGKLLGGGIRRAAGAAVA